MNIQTEKLLTIKKGLMFVSFLNTKVRYITRLYVYLTLKKDQGIIK